LHSVGGYDVAGLSETADSKNVRWTLSALPTTTILTACAADFADARFATNYALLAAWARAQGERVLEHRGTPYRVLIDALDGGTPAVLLPLDKLFEIRARTAVRLWRALSGLAPGADPAALSQQRQVRLLDALRALDGRQKGASYRELADVLFGRKSITSSSWKTHSLRDRIIRTVRLGEALMRGDYRRLLLHPYRRRVALPPIRGGDLALP
jgi:hypothetical protein